ncbi:MFS family permease [Bradyrhizobium sp. AZCC 1578]
MVDVAPEAAAQVEATARPSLQRYYVLALLTVIYALNFLDRTIFNVLIEPIKKEFALSDTTMGLLAGFGFVLFYSLLGVPIARIADRFNRRNIVAIALAFWSAMTVFCGMAQSVATLALARIGVGIGESGGTPASQSIIADLFSKNEGPRALGIYAIGTYLGVFLGYFIGFLASQRTFVIVLIGFCLTSYTNYATSAWIPPFLARVHQLSSAEIGTYAGTFKGLSGMAGTLVGGLVVALVSRRDDRWKLWAPAIMSGLAGPVFALCMLTPDFTTMVAALALTSFLVGFHLGPIFAVAQTVARSSMRALASAIVLVDRDLLWPGRRSARRRHAQRRAQERFWRGGRAVFAAVGRGHDHLGRPVVHLGGRIDSRRYPAGELIRPARRRLFPLFLLLFRTRCEPRLIRHAGCM